MTGPRTMDKPGGILVDRLTSYELAVAVACDGDLTAHLTSARAIRGMATLEDMLEYAEMDKKIREARQVTAV